MSLKVLLMNGEIVHLCVTPRESSKSLRIEPFLACEKWPLLICDSPPLVDSAAWVVVAGCTVTLGLLRLRLMGKQRQDDINVSSCITGGLQQLQELLAGAISRK
jgi:hypothetical protein